MASTIVGTPQYLSPEMCDNKPYGKKSDVWALGCILYELCTLTKAFDLGNGGISGIILKIIRGTYTPLPDCYSEEMKALVGSMLQVRLQCLCLNACLALFLSCVDAVLI
jgi:NIMA (never in mitosis gene a)-related kinase